MKKPLRLFLILLLLVVVSIAAYYYLNPKKAVKVVFPEVEQFENVHVKLLRDSAMIDLSVKVQNNGVVKLTLDSLIYKIGLDSTTMLKKREDLDVALAPGEEDTVALTLALPVSKLKKKIRSLSEDSTDINLDLEVLYSTWLGDVRLPLQRNLRIKTPKPPKIEVVKTELIRREKKTFFVNATVKIHNYGSLNLSLSDLKYRMDVEDLFTAEDQYNKKIVIKPASSQTIVLPITIEVHKLIKAAWLVLTDNDVVHYRLYVKGMLETEKMKGDKTPIEVEKKDVLELKK